MRKVLAELHSTIKELEKDGFIHEANILNKEAIKLAQYFGDEEDDNDIQNNDDVNDDINDSIELPEFFDVNYDPDEDDIMNEGPSGFKTDTYTSPDIKHKKEMPNPLYSADPSERDKHLSDKWYNSILDNMNSNVKNPVISSIIPLK